jgi:AcrR family transcriptional regulator
MTHGCATIISMARKYELKRRAERQEDTRRRIVQAAVALHTTLGPARTSVSAIAAKAGVQRHTFYRHFPDERSLSLACSGLYTEQHPAPDPESLRDIADAAERLERGIGLLYDYFERNAGELWPIVRDAETHALTREMMELRFQPVLRRMVEVLVEPFQLPPAGRRPFESLLEILLDFPVWRRLRASVGSAAETVDLAVCALLGVLAERADPRPAAAAPSSR